MGHSWSKHRHAAPGYRADAAAQGQVWRRWRHSRFPQYPCEKGAEARNRAHRLCDLPAAARVFFAKVPDQGFAVRRYGSPCELVSVLVWGETQPHRGPRGGTVPMPAAIRFFAEHVSRTRFEDLPAAAVRAARIFMLDTIGVGLAGSNGPRVAGLIESAAAMMGEGPARCWGHRRTLSAPGAAMINGYQIHNSEFDCVHEAAVIHPMTVCLAAVMAHADRNGGVGGSDLITAVVLGVDTACHLGVATTTGLRFFRPATA